MTLWNQCQQAASKLDDIRPGWYNRINLDFFSMGSCDSCVIGQVVDKFFSAGSMYSEVRELGLPVEAMGFKVSVRYTKLTKYWETLIKQRRQKEE